MPLSILATPEASGAVFGVSGLQKVEYKGSRKAIIKGACTGHRYEFGDMRYLGFVDARDVEGLLSLTDQDGNLLFEVL